MHELTLAERAVSIVERTARAAAANRVTRIRLAIGVLAHVDAETLQYCCGIAARGTLAEGAEILVETCSGRAWCEDCERETVLARLGDPCRECGGFRLRVSDGDRMQVLDIGIE